MNTTRKPNARGLLFACLGLLLNAASSQAQNADATIQSYIAAANNLSAKLAQIVDADSAQRNAPYLPAPINSLNPLVAQIKALYGVPSSAPALQAHATALTTAQTKLAQEQKRLLTGNCDQEGTITSLNSNDSIQLAFTNRSSVPVQLFWIDYSGKRVWYLDVGVNESSSIYSYATHPWLAADKSGKCMLIVQPAQTTDIIISPVLAPTVASYLAKIAK
jgi:hypothetical protein